MSQPVDLKPAWLVDLMCRWARVSRAQDNRHIGYPTQVAWLAIGGSSGAKDPVIASASVFTELEDALTELRETAVGQYVAMAMHYKPWGIEACIAQGWPFGGSTYYWRLHKGHENVAATIKRLREIKEKRENS